MLKIGDIVKVISPTKHFDEYKEFYPIGTICKVVETNGDEIELISLDSYNYVPYYYFESEVEKR